MGYSIWDSIGNYNGGSEGMKKFQSITAPITLSHITFKYGNSKTQEAKYISPLYQWKINAKINIPNKTEEKIISWVQDELAKVSPNTIIKSGCADVSIAFWTNGKVKITASGMRSWRFSWSVTFDAPEDILNEIELYEGYIWSDDK